MKGFDSEFNSVDHYIRTITDRVWEGRRLDDIRRYYSEDCAVETPSSVTIGVEQVIDGTRATQAAFPDRRLLAEEIIISGDDVGGYLSSHRIFSPMTHAGPGVFGPPTGRAIYVRTIADCICINNRIVHEWLVRDQGAIARQVGREPRELAQSWLDAAGRFAKPSMPPAPAPYRSLIDAHPAASILANSLRSIWSHHAFDALPSSHAQAIIASLPGGDTAVGLRELHRFWASFLSCFEPADLLVEHLVANEKSGRATAVAMRWRSHVHHTNRGRFGEPTGRKVEVMGITHAEVQSGRIVREWHLVDELAIWMQVLAPSDGGHGAN